MLSRRRSHTCFGVPPADQLAQFMESCATRRAPNLSRKIKVRLSEASWMKRTHMLKNMEHSKHGMRGNALDTTKRGCPSLRNSVHCGQYQRVLEGRLTPTQSSGETGMPETTNKTLRMLLCVQLFIRTPTESSPQVRSQVRPPGPLKTTALLTWLRTYHW